jgi:lipopolysaccharide biosynthesis regulator YciM
VTSQDLHQALAGLGLLALVALAIAMSRHRRRRTEAQAYLKGVRSMLSDDPDAAIEALSSAARLGTPQARETYLALGALFRRTGDLSRAIRLHRNMLAGPALAGADRREVERELAEDYRRSGMLDEAAELLEPQAATDRAAVEALREVRAGQGAWREAAALQARLAGGPDRLQAHLLAAAARAELAAAAEATPEAAARAVAAAAEAVAVDPGCAAAWLARAEAAGAAGDGAAALGALERALQIDPRAAVLAWPALARLPDPAAGLRLLASRAAEAPGDAGVRMLEGRLLHRLGRRREALAALRAALEADLNGEVTLALRELLREAEPTGSDGSAQPAGAADLPARHELLVLALARRARAVRCGRCGAEAAARAWRCRACGAFDSMAC